MCFNIEYKCKDCGHIDRSELNPCAQYRESPHVVCADDVLKTEYIEVFHDGCTFGTSVIEVVHEDDAEYLFSN